MKNQRTTELAAKISNNLTRPASKRLEIDLPAIAELSEAQCEAAIHLTVDRISELAETAPLEALDSVIALMQQASMELY